MSVAIRCVRHQLRQIHQRDFVVAAALAGAVEEHEQRVAFAGLDVRRREQPVGVVLAAVVEGQLGEWGGLRLRCQGPDGN